jgi:hypothetical protein
MKEMRPPDSAPLDRDTDRVLKKSCLDCSHSGLMVNAVRLSREKRVEQYIRIST